MAILIDPIKRFERTETSEIGGPAGWGYAAEQKLRPASALYIYGKVIDQFREYPAELQRLVEMEPDAVVRADVRHMVDRVGIC